MEQNIYERLFYKMKDYSNSEFPIMSFLNDIRDNKDKNFNKKEAYNDLEKTFDTFMEYHDEVQEYKQLENEIGCPLEVRCKLYDGAIIYDENGRKMIVRNLGEHDFLTYQTKGASANLMYIKGYKKSWWLKADKSK